MRGPPRRCRCGQARATPRSRRARDHAPNGRRASRSARAGATKARRRRRSALLAGGRGFDQRRRMREPRLRLRQRGPFVGGRRRAPRARAAAPRALRAPRPTPWPPPRPLRACDRRVPRVPRVAVARASAVKPPNASTRARCTLAAVSDWCACWPWRSTSCSPMSFNCASVAGAAVDPRAASALRIQRAAQEQRTPSAEARSCSASHSRCRDARPLEHGGELGSLGARPQLPQLEPIAEQEAERIEQDRLSRAGLAGQHREAGIELEVERFDDDEIADGQQAKHRRCGSVQASSLSRNRSGVSLQCSFSRSIAK